MECSKVDRATRNAESVCFWAPGCSPAVPRTLAEVPGRAPGGRWPCAGSEAGWARGHRARRRAGSTASISPEGDRVRHQTAAGRRELRRIARDRGLDIDPTTATASPPADPARSIPSAHVRPRRSATAGAQRARGDLCVFRVPGPRHAATRTTRRTVGSRREGDDALRRRDRRPGAGGGRGGRPGGISIQARMNALRVVRERPTPIWRPAIDRPSVAATARAAGPREGRENDAAEEVDAILRILIDALATLAQDRAVGRAAWKSRRPSPSPTEQRALLDEGRWRDHGSHSTQAEAARPCRDRVAGLQAMLREVASSGIPGLPCGRRRARRGTHLLNQLCEQASG